MTAQNLEGSGSEAHAFVEDFNESVTDFLARADRTNLKAAVFNVPRRTEVTLPCYSRLAPAYFREIAVSVSPRELGEQMRALAVRPNALHLNGVFWQLLLERERRLVVGLEPLPQADLESLLDWVGQVLVALRGDGTVFPCERTGWHARILPKDRIGELADQGEIWSSEELADLRHLSASLELYSFMLHGEHRDGIFDHGPYPLPGGRLAMVKDFTDLQSTFLPWATPEVRLDHEAVSLVWVLEGIGTPRVNWAGTAEYDAEPYDHLAAAAAFTVRDGVATRLRPEAWRLLGKAAQRAQRTIFMSAAGWSDEEKITYGSWLFANHLQGIPTFLGLDPRIGAEMAAEFERQVAEELDRLDLSEPSPLWARLRRGRPFSEIEEEKNGN